MELVLKALGLIIVILAVVIRLMVWVWHRRWIGKPLVITFLVYCLLDIYWAVHPPASFYQGEFEYITGLQFPASGRFIYTEATFPNPTGDYSSCALFEVTQEDYDTLYEILASRSSTSVGAFGCDTQQLDDMLRGKAFAVTWADQNRHRRDESMDCRLVADAPLILINYSSW